MPDMDKVIKGLESCRYGCPGDDCPYHEGINCAELMTDALALLKEQPQIVRCKDCKHAKYSDGKNVWCEFVDDGFCHDADWFCADGERRTE